MNDLLNQSEKQSGHQPGRLYGIGVGSGDPELLTLKAYRLLQSAPVVAYPVSDGGKSLSRSIVADYLRKDQVEVPLWYPFKLEKSSQPYYDAAALKLAEYLDAGQDVVVLCEGDPFFYGTFMYLFNRLSPHYTTEVVPGISSIMASASALDVPLTYRNDVFVVLPGVLPAEVLANRLAIADAAVIIKLGKNFAKVYGVLEQLGLLDRARYIERATMANQRIVPIREVDPATVPYFALISIPSRWTPETLSIMNMKRVAETNEIEIQLLVNSEQLDYRVTPGVTIGADLEKMVNTGDVRRMQNFLATIDRFNQGEKIDFPVHLDQ